MVTFNVVFTPGTVARLLPFALSLLRGSGVSVRLVANGCEPAEADLLRAAAGDNERVEPHVLPGPRPAEHGLALNDLFERFADEAHFAFADSDVVASGDFMRTLWPPRTDEAAVFSGAPVWLTDADAVAPRGAPLLSGRQRALHDGTPIGGSYVAIYDRTKLEPAWRAAPRGFAVHARRMVPANTRAALRARGWDHQLLDTCRLVNLHLLLAGHSLANRVVPELHHVGGYSTGAFTTPLAQLRTLPEIVRTRDVRRAWAAAERRRWQRRALREPGRRRMEERRRVVLAHVGAVLDAVAAGDPHPPAPPTDSVEVDRRVAALVSAIVANRPAA